MQLRLLILTLFLFLRNTGHSAPYFDVAPIETFSTHRIPCISVLIEDKKYLCAFDSGCMGQLFIVPELLAEIKDKTFSAHSILQGVRGNKYTLPVYIIPKATIGKTEFLETRIQEESRAFLMDGLINQECQSIDSKAGRVGWELYKPFNLLLDIPHLRIGCCDSIETLERHGYPIHHYIKAPLLQSSECIGIQLSMKNRTLNCLLDTGATQNILNLEGFDRQTVILDSVKIGDEELGPLIFCAFPIKLSFPIDAILGMDFLLKHTVFIDFKNQCAYISKSYPIFDWNLWNTTVILQNLLNSQLVQNMH